MGESTSLGSLNGTEGAPTLCRACRGPHGLFPVEIGLPLRRVFARDSWLSIFLPGLSVPQLRQVALVMPCCPWASGRGVSSCFPLVHSVPRCLWGACPVSGPCLSGSCGPAADRLYWVPPGRDCCRDLRQAWLCCEEGTRHSSVQTVTSGLQPCSVARALSGRFMSACWGQCLVSADPCPPAVCLGLLGRGVRQEAGRGWAGRQGGVAGSPIGSWAHSWSLSSSVSSMQCCG